MGIIFIKNKIQKNKTENENKRDKRSFVEFLLHVVAHDVSHVSIPKIKILVIMSRSKKVINNWQRCSRSETISPSGSFEDFRKTLNLS